MEWPLLSSLSPPDRARVVAAARRRRFARAEVVFHEGDPGDAMHLVETGHVAVRVTTPQGDVATLRVLGPGDFFGELALLSSGPRSATVAAVEAATTRVLHRHDLDVLRREHPAVERLLLDATVAEVRRLSSQLAESLYVPVPKRVRRRLLELHALYGGGEQPVTVPLSQEDLAGLAGSTRPTVNKVLQDLQAAGVVRVGRGRIEVLDAAALARRAR